MNTDSQAPEKHLPFYCGSQRMDWTCFNCAQCAKGYDEKASAWRCDLEKAIDASFMGDGSVTDEIARRMGMPADCRVHNWRCPEFVAAPPRPAEPAKSHAENKPAYWMAEWAAARGLKL